MTSSTRPDTSSPPTPVQPENRHRPDWVTTFFFILTGPCPWMGAFLGGWLWMAVALQAGFPPGFTLWGVGCGWLAGAWIEARVWQAAAED
jgi:hypothetical protein